MDRVRKEQLENKALGGLCIYEWLSFITVSATIVAFGVVAWYSFDVDYEKNSLREEFSRLPIVEK